MHVVDPRDLDPASPIPSPVLDRTVWQELRLRHGTARGDRIFARCRNHPSAADRALYVRAATASVLRHLTDGVEGERDHREEEAA